MGRLTSGRTRLLDDGGCTIEEGMQMVAVGLILLLLGLGGGGLMAWMALERPMTVYLGPSGFTIGVLPITLFLSGMVCMLLIWLGVRLTVAGARRRSAQRAQLKQLRSSTAAQDRAVGDRQGPPSE